MNPLLDETHPDYDPDLALTLGMTVERQQGTLISTAREVVKKRSAMRFNGHFVDLFTASAIVAVADALSEENCAKLNAMSPDKAVGIVWKLIK